MTYRVEIARAARKEIARLPHEAYERVVKAIAEFADNPRLAISTS